MKCKKSTNRFFYKKIAKSLFFPQKMLYNKMNGFYKIRPDYMLKGNHAYAE